jgi:hypothetical protein
MAIMKRFRILFVLAVLVVAGWSGGMAVAATVSGQLGMMGKGMLNAPLATATGFTMFGGARVGYGMGMYDVPGVMAVNTPVALTLTDFTGSPAVPVTLWELESGGKTYSFELHSLEHERFFVGENVYLTVSGRGMALVDGGGAIPALFCFSTQQCIESTGTEVTWSAEAILCAVPEGGAAWVCLLFGIIGIEGLRRKLS